MQSRDICQIIKIFDFIQGYHGLMKEKERWEPPDVADPLHSLLPAHHLAWAAPPRLEGLPGPPPPPPPLESGGGVPSHSTHNHVAGDPNGEPPPGNSESPASTGTSRQAHHHPVNTYYRVCGAFET